jgi:hypothetical protein
MTVGFAFPVRSLCHAATQMLLLLRRPTPMRSRSQARPLPSGEQAAPSTRPPCRCPRRHVSGGFGSTPPSSTPSSPCAAAPWALGRRHRRRWQHWPGHRLPPCPLAAHTIRAALHAPHDYALCAPTRINPIFSLFNVNFSQKYMLMYLWTLDLLWGVWCF